MKKAVSIRLSTKVRAGASGEFTDLIWVSSSDVDLEVFLTFHKIQAFTNDAKVIATALESSEILKVICHSHYQCFTCSTIEQQVCVKRFREKTNMQFYNYGRSHPQGFAIVEPQGE